MTLYDHTVCVLLYYYVIMRDVVVVLRGETVAVCNSVQCPVMTCVHIAETGGECRWSGSEYW